MGFFKNAIKGAGKDTWNATGGKAIKNVKTGVKNHVGHWKKLGSENHRERAEGRAGLWRHARKLGPGAAIGATAAVGAKALGAFGAKKTAASWDNVAKSNFQENHFLDWVVMLGFINFFLDWVIVWFTKYEWSQPNPISFWIDILTLAVLLVVLVSMRGNLFDVFLIIIIFWLEAGGTHPFGFYWIRDILGLSQSWWFQKAIWPMWVYGSIFKTVFSKPGEEKSKYSTIAATIMVIIWIVFFVMTNFGAIKDIGTEQILAKEGIDKEDEAKFEKECMDEAGYGMGIIEWLNQKLPTQSECVKKKIDEKKEREEQAKKDILLTGWKEEQSADHIKVKSKTYTPTKESIEYELQISNPKDEISITDIKCLNEYSSERDMSIYYEGKDYNAETEWLPELANLKGRELPGGKEFYYPIDVTCFPSELKKGINHHTIEVMIEGINLKARSTLLYTNKEAVETMLYNYRFEYPDKRKPQKPDSKNLDRWKKDMFNYYKEAYIFSGQGTKETIDTYFPAGYVASTHLEKLAVIELGLIKGGYEAVPIIGLNPEEKTTLVWQIIIRNLEDFGRVEEIKNIEVSFPKFMKPMKDYCDLELVDDSSKTEDIYKMLDKDALMRVKVNLQSLEKGKGFIPIIRECRVEIDPTDFSSVLSGINPREVEVRMDISYKIEEEFKIHVAEESINPDAIPSNVGNDPQIVKDNPETVNKIKSLAAKHGVPEDIVVAIALQESRLSHYSTSGGVLRGGNKEPYDWGIMQINGNHKQYGCFDSNAEKSDLCAVDSCIGTNVVDSMDCNIEAAVRLLKIYYDDGIKNYPNGRVYTCNGKTYKGWDYALRRYNGWGESTYFCQLVGNYVENIKAREDAISVIV